MQLIVIHGVGKSVIKKAVLVIRLRLPSIHRLQLSVLFWKRFKDGNKLLKEIFIGQKICCEKKYRLSVHSVSSCALPSTCHTWSTLFALRQSWIRWLTEKIQFLLVRDTYNTLRFFLAAFNSGKSLRLERPPASFALGTEKKPPMKAKVSIFAF